MSPLKDHKAPAAKVNFSRLRRAILIRVLLVPFLILMLICGTLVYHFAINLYAGVKQELIEVAGNHRQIIEQFLSERVRDLQFVAESVQPGEIGTNRNLLEIFQRLHHKSEAFFDLGVFDAAGNHVAYYGPYDLAGKNYAETAWFRAVQAQPVYISDVFLGFREAPHFIIAVRGGTRDTPWYLRATIDTRFFNELVENIRIGETGEAYLVNKEGLFQTRRRSGGQLMAKDPDRSTYRQAQNGIVSFVTESPDGNLYLYAADYLDITGWRLMVRQCFWDAFSPLVRAIVIAAALIIVGGVVVLLIAFLLATTMANRLTVAEVEKREMGSQLIMAGKLAEVGEMSAGMAHEINNPLQIMSVEFTLIEDVLGDFADRPLDSEATAIIKDSLHQIGLQINRCREITHGLLKFSRKSDMHIRPVNLDALISESVRMIETPAQLQGAAIRVSADKDLPLIQSDPDQLQQVLVNLINNALYAVAEKSAAEIHISAERVDGRVALAVTDNGCGIPPDDLEKIFLPFFTTKPVGKGTGLGLSTCYGIVERLGGRMAVSSEPGAGTVFTVYLPLPEGNQAEVEKKINPENLTTNTERRTP